MKILLIISDLLKIQVFDIIMELYQKFLIHLYIIIKIMKHIQLPNEIIKNLTPDDIWIYICIKSYYNPNNKTCNPPLRTIAEKSELSVNTVRKCITSLSEEGWIIVEKQGKSQNYKFKSYKNFEMFSIPFIEKKDITPKEKSYIISSQQFMYKDVIGIGKISYTNKELSNKINLSETRIAKYDESLVNKGYLSLIESSKKDVETGLLIKNKFFRLNELEQSIIFTLQNHEEKINETDKAITLVLKENAELKRREELLEKRIQFLENKELLEKNESINNDEIII